MPKKKPYQKPEIKQVGLIPEEAVLVACKLNTGSDTGPDVDCYKNSIKKCSDIAT